MKGRLWIPIVLSLFLVVAAISCGSSVSPTSPEGANGPPSGWEGEGNETPVPPDETDDPEEEEPLPPTPPEEPIDVPVELGPDSGLPPNELGSVVVLMYHHVGDENSTWVRSRERFREDLTYLYENGYRPITMESYLTGHIDLPEGMSPILLTFDDGLSNQLRWLDEEIGSPDPECAVGILMDFAEAHEGFDARAVFYVNSPRPFYPIPEEDIADSLQWLIEQGFELGNHTHYHPNLRELSDEGVQRALALTHRMLGQWVPDHKIHSMALPFGVWPSNRALAYQGGYEDVSYEYAGVMLVGAEPAPSPFAQSFTPRATPRVRASDDQWELWFGQMEQHPLRRYVSDGSVDTITIPQSLHDRLDEARVPDHVDVILQPQDESSE